METMIAGVHIEGATHAVPAVRHTVRHQPSAHTNMATLSVAEKWAAGTKCTGWVLLFVCEVGKALFGGIIFQELGMMDDSCIHASMDACT